MTNIVLKDPDTLEKFDLLVDYAVLQKVLHTVKNKVELGKQMLDSKTEPTYLVTVKSCNSIWITVDFFLCFYEKENKQNLKNYRPISLLPVAGKIFER